MAITDIVSTGRELLTLIPALVKANRNPVSWDDETSMGTCLAETAARYPDRPALTCEGTSITWREFDEMVNQAAHALRGHGVNAGDCVSLFMENRIEFLVELLAIVRLGATAALINTNLRGPQLMHCLNTTGAHKLVFGGELSEAVAEIKSECGLTEGQDFLWVADDAIRPPNWAQDLKVDNTASPSHVPDDLPVVRRRDPALYIFTSGTTGMPKAAIMAHGRLLAGGEGSLVAGLKVKPTDRFYLCLPLYHGTGLVVGFTACLVSGASAFLRRKFSASRFLDEVREQQCNTFIYIGELCRYLLAQPERPTDHSNPLEKMTGNGLRPDIWMAFKRRFGVKRIIEFYGATEGNTGFINLFNRNCTIGTNVTPANLIAYDVDADQEIRDETGRCLEVPDGEPGLLIAPITETAIFEGYTNKEATEKKILRDVFEPGDTYFNSGDLIKTINVGYAFGYKHYQFVDRVGDTFRWKGENCSTNEVAEIINLLDEVELTNVYGVEIPGTDGRAGMAAVKIRAGQEFDPVRFSEHVNEHLAPYARPVFVRLLKEVEVTGTFKLVKGELRDAAYHPDRTDDEIYVMQPGDSMYSRLTPGFYQEIQDASAGF